MAANRREISRKSFQKFLKLLNFRIRSNSTKNSRFPERKVDWKENFREKKFENLGIPLEVAPFLEFLKMPLHSLLEVAENSNPTFWLNGKRPQLLAQSRDSQYNKSYGVPKKIP